MHFCSTVLSIIEATSPVVLVWLLLQSLRYKHHPHTPEPQKPSPNSLSPPQKEPTADKSDSTQSNPWSFLTFYRLMGQSYVIAVQQTVDKSTWKLLSASFLMPHTLSKGPSSFPEQSQWQKKLKWGMQSGRSQSCDDRMRSCAFYTNRPNFKPTSNWSITTRTNQ